MEACAEGIGGRIVAKAKVAERKCVNGAEPDGLYPVPPEGNFDAEAYQRAEGPAQIAVALIDGDVFFERLRGVSILHLWKDGLPAKLLGRCRKVSERGFEAWLAALGEVEELTYVLEYNAKGLRGAGVTHWQMEALVYHQLRHIDLDGEKPSTRKHEFEGFADELGRYGAWHPGADSIIKGAGLAPAWEQRMLVVPEPEPEE